jgi:DNA repair exonuclease SbcCD ATPase subunit
MRNSVLTLTALAIIAGTMFCSCQSSEKKVENAKGNLKDAKAKVVEAQDELNSSKAEYQKFKQESEEKITANEKKIAEFKAKIANEKAENKGVYDKDIAWLEQKNTDLKTKLDSYQGEGRENWEKFKKEFNHDMDELGKAFNDFTVKNVK